MLENINNHEYTDDHAEDGIDYSSDVVIFLAYGFYSKIIET